MLTVKILKEVIEKAEEYGERYAKMIGDRFEHFDMDDDGLEYAFKDGDDGYYGGCCHRQVKFEEFIEYCDDPDGYFAPLEKEAADKKAKEEKAKKKEEQRKKKNKDARERAAYKRLKKKFEKEE
jgi:hypothetical protein